MPVLPAARRTLALLCPLGFALTLSACGSTVSTSSFSGEQHAVAQAIANLQADATAGDQKKLCANDLAATVVAKLGGKQGCEKAIKTQLTEIGVELSVQSIQIAPGGATATAHVKSTYYGKTRPGTLSLAKEASGWRITATS